MIRWVPMKTLTYTRIAKELVMQAVEDRINGNRPLTSRAYLQRRIAEVQYDRSATEENFREFEKSLYKILTRRYHSIRIKPAFTVKKSWLGKLSILGAQDGIR